MTPIAVGGFLHETNTFAPTRAGSADFVHGGGWPAMSQGATGGSADAGYVGIEPTAQAILVNKSSRCISAPISRRSPRRC